jgi:hypothetical protein
MMLVDVDRGRAEGAALAETLGALDDERERERERERGYEDEHEHEWERGRAERRLSEQSGE